MIEVVNLTLVDRHEAYSNWGATWTTSYTMWTRGRVTLSKQSLPDMRQQLLRAAISMLRDASQNNQNTWQQNQQESSGVKVPSWSVCTIRKGRSPYSSLHQLGDQTRLLCRAHSTSSLTLNIQRIYREQCGSFIVKKDILMREDNSSASHPS